VHLCSCPSTSDEKGQDLIEYALLLAIVVGIGYLIYTTSGLNDNIQIHFHERK
jgi:Flp pilus assembly pilin Flp